jgi:integrase/recombinase XerD
VVPELFRLLYSYVLRVSEALHLHVADVDLEVGVLTIHQSKFRKDRLVPLTPALTQRLRQYVDVVGNRPDEAIFFPLLRAAPIIAASYTRSSVISCG